MKLEEPIVYEMKDSHLDDFFRIYSMNRALKFNGIFAIALIVALILKNELSNVKMFLIVVLPVMIFSFVVCFSDANTKNSLLKGGVFELSQDGIKRILNSGKPLFLRYDKISSVKTRNTYTLVIGSRGDSKLAPYIGDKKGQYGIDFDHDDIITIPSSTKNYNELIRVLKSKV